MNEERRMILQMVQDGAISVDEAEKLMEAMSASEEKSDPVSDYPAIAATPKRITVQVTEGGKNKVNVKVPFSLVKAGLKLGQSIGVLSAKRSNLSEEEAAALEMLKDIDIDEIVSSIGSGEIALPYALVDVDDEENGTHVRIMIE